MVLGTKMRCIQPMHCVKIGDTGVYTFGADYVPGWDAGRFDVTLDNPRKRQAVMSHWTEEEMLRYWEEIKDV